MYLKYQFDPPTVDLILEGLAELPYKRVAQTIQAIGTAAQQQVTDAQSAAADAAKASRRKSAKKAAP